MTKEEEKVILKLQLIMDSIEDGSVKISNIRKELNDLINYCEIN